MMEKKKLAIVFGGQSTEHEVSCVSAATVASEVDRDEWDIILIGIAKDGRWLLVESIDSMSDPGMGDSEVSAEISPDASKRSVILTDAEGHMQRIRLDCVFPVLHGKYGEDGTIQGLFELARIPYVGCGVFASAASMDKLYTKIIVDTIGIRQAKYTAIRRYELSDPEKLAAVIGKAEEELDYPMFVKPSRAGSSVGVSKVRDRDSLIEALYTAAEVDSKILIEEFIKGREIECAVLGGGETKVYASGVGEILAAAEFYDYEAKYHNAESRTVVDPDLPDETVQTVRRAAASIFNALDGYGLARVDFFVKDSGEVVFNEINTMPGFTAISMYPMLWENRGHTKRQLVKKLLDLAMMREML